MSAGGPAVPAAPRCRGTPRPMMGSVTMAMVGGRRLVQPGHRADHDDVSGDRPSRALAMHDDMHAVADAADCPGDLAADLAEAVVVTVTAHRRVYRTRLVPGTRSSTPDAAAAPGHPFTAVAAVSARAGRPESPSLAASPYEMPPAATITAAAAAISACGRRPGQPGPRGGRNTRRCPRPSRCTRRNRVMPTQERPTARRSGHPASWSA
jgi:hypothetical protein